MSRPLRVLYLEPFDGGSHAAFGRALRDHADRDVAWTMLTLPARHWKWRMRGSALWWAERHPAELAAPHDVLLCSSFTPLAELVALAPQLAARPKVLYFHENQWAYPVRENEPRDHHFGFTQLASAAVADRCWFNSTHNRDSFLDESRAVLRRMPDTRPGQLVDAIAARSEVVGFPVAMSVRPTPTDVAAGAARSGGPHLLWNHRWEHDKDPETWFSTMLGLHRRGVPFRLLVCGERYARWPALFDRARSELAGHIAHWGPLADRADYLAVLDRAQLAVSTARHEFFGVATVEAVHHGARPLAPQRLAYPEVLGPAHCYPDDAALLDTLTELCTAWTAGRIDLRGDRGGLVGRHAAERVVPALLDRLTALAQAGR